MRLTLFFMVVACLHVSGKGVSQTISYSAKDVSLEKVFSVIKRQTGYVVFCNSAAIRDVGHVSVEASKVNLSHFLDQLFTGKPLEYTIKGKTIFVSRKIVVVEERPLYQAPPPIDVRGRITDNKGMALPGVSVVVKGGKGRGTNTDAGGNFNILADAGDVLVISSVGYLSISVRIAQAANGALNASVTVAERQTGIAEDVSGNAADISSLLNTGIDALAIRLVPKIVLEDVVTVKTNYWETSKRKSVGNAAIVTAKDIEKQPVANPLLAMQGRMAGVMIEQQVGVPGGGIKIQIRGRNSIRPNGNDPLYVIDGVPFPSAPLNSGNAGIIRQGNPLSNINPADIENIQVLKDADVTAIYGSQGANGVVLITTKKGRTGKARVDINVYTGIGKVPKKMDLLNTQQYLDMRREAFTNDNETPGTEDYDVNGVWNQSRYTDWQKVLIGGTAGITNAQASVSGGNNNMQYLVSGNYYRETTVFPGNYADQKYSTRFSIGHTSNNRKLSISCSGGYLVDDNRLMRYDLTGYAMQLSPNAPAPYTPDGKINWENNTWNNPLSVLLQDFRSRSTTFEGNSVLSYEIVKGLQAKVNFGYTEIKVDEQFTQPLGSQRPGSASTGYLTIANNNIQTWITEPQISYTKQIGRSRLSALVGLTFRESKSRNTSLSAGGFASDALIYNLQAATFTQDITASSPLYHYNAVFGRINYEWDGKYLINFTGRRDGSSRFGPGKQFANFGAAGIGWIFTGEPFMQKSMPWLSYGKIRASYGSTGNDGIGDYGFYDQWQSTYYPYAGTPGLYPYNLYNPDFAWEINRKLEIALELAFLNDRVTTGISYYRNRSGNQLVGYSLPYSTGFSSIQSNLPALVQNTGLELELTAAIVRSKNFTWTSALNLTFPRNKLIAYPDLENSPYRYDYKVGKSLYTYASYHFTGVDPATGEYTMEDVDGNGSSTDFPQDWQFRVEATQQIFGGFQNTFEYKGWQLDLMLQLVQQQGTIYDYPRDAGAMQNQPVYVLNRWQKPGDQAPVRKFSIYSAPGYITDANIGDASYMRLKNLSLSYRLPAGFIQQAGLTEGRLYIQAQNLFTITGYNGLDPETQSMDNLPTLRVLTAGIRLTF